MFMKDYYKLSVDETLNELNAAPTGLSSEKAAERLAQYGPNKLKEAEKPGFWKRFLTQLKDPMLLILLAAAGVSALTGALAGESEWAETIIILVVVLLNAVLGVLQESKAEAAIEALQTMTAATCKVLRDGKMAVLHSDELVPGDVVLLEAGDAVPADGRIIESASLKIEEAALTGESLGGFVDYPDVTIDGNRLSARVSGLQPETTYIFYAYADLPTGRTRSASVAFVTGKSSGNPTFGTPSATDVTTTTATLKCGITFDRDATDYAVYFRYKTASADDYTVVATTAGSGEKSVTLTGLTPGVDYEFQLCVGWVGATYASATGRFTTLQLVTPGKTRYAGWAELPAEADHKDGYYYAYHMRADLKTMRNYSVCYSADKRTGMWSAFPLHECYRGDQDRTKKWYYDPAVPQAVQPDLIDGSYQPQPGYSKGHLIASNDRTISYEANSQTFYVTNVAPQWQNSFNGGVWSLLEEDCWKNICADTLYIVSGVYFANDDTTVTDQSDDTCIVPTNFYRVLMRSKAGNTGKPLWELSADQIKCVGFWFENRAYSGGKPSSGMMSVADIEQKVGFEFFPNVPLAPKDTYNKSDWTFR